jgi:hypothetical protein
MNILFFSMYCNRDEIVPQLITAASTGLVSPEASIVVRVKPRKRRMAALYDRPLCPLQRVLTLVAGMHIHIRRPNAFLIAMPRGSSIKRIVDYSSKNHSRVGAPKRPEL